MSQTVIERIVGRAVLDREFLDALLRDPEAVLKDYDLRAEDRRRIAETVRGLSAAEARKLAAAFEAQVGERKAAGM